MSKLQNNDQPLVDFLRQNRPDVPPVNEELEARIMALVEASPSSEPVKKSSVIPFRRRRFWLMQGAIAAGLAIAWGTNYLLTPKPPTAIELASLELFIEDTWDGVLEEEYQNDWDLGF